MKKENLTALRDEIDKLDQELLMILAKRTEVVRKIGVIKKENSIQPLDETRWKAVLKDKLQKAKELNLPTKMVRSIYKRIHKYSLEIEEINK